MKKFFQRLRAAWTLANFTPLGGGVSSKLQVPGVGRPAENILMVYAALKARGDALKQVPLRASDANDNLIETGPLAALLEQPNQLQDGVAYLETLEGYLTLFDEAFVAIIGAPGAALELVPLHPRGMQIVDGVHKPTGIRMPLGWIYTDPFTGQTTRFVTDDIIAITGFNPHAPLRGLAPDLAARRAFQADLAAREHNLGIFLNGGTPDVALETDQRWTKEQVDEFMDFWSARYSGFQNAHKPAVLYGGLKVNKLGLTNQDLQFLEGIRKTDQEILTALRVYPAMVGLMIGETGLSQGSSTSSQKIAWWTDVGLPELARIASAHQRALAPRFAGSARGARALSTFERRLVRKSKINNSQSKLYFWFDENQIEALVEHRRSRLDQFDKLLGRGYTPDEISAYFDLGLPPHPTNLGTLPLGVQAVTDLALPPPEPAPTTPAPEPPRALVLLDQMREHVCGCGAEHRADLPPKAAALHGHFLKAVNQHTKVCARKISGYFVEQRGRVLDRLAAVGRVSDPAQLRAAADDLLAKIFPSAEENEHLIKRLLGSWTDGMKDGWKFYQQQTGGPSPFTVEDVHIQKALAKRKLQGSKMNDTTREDLRKVLSDSIAAGDSTTQTGDAIADYYAKQIGPSSARPQTAARTQMAGIVNDGQLAAAREAGGLLKYWIHGGAEEPRPDHIKAQERYAEGIPLDEKFKINDVELDAPGDADADVSETANCTCMLGFKHAE